MFHLLLARQFYWYALHDAHLRLKRAARTHRSPSLHWRPLLSAMLSFVCRILVRACVQRKLRALYTPVKATLFALSHYCAILNTWRSPTTRFRYCGCRDRHGDRGHRGPLRYTSRRNSQSGFRQCARVEVGGIRCGLSIGCDQRRHHHC